MDILQILADASLLIRVDAFYRTAFFRDAAHLSMVVEFQLLMLQGLQQYQMQNFIRARHILEEHCISMVQYMLS